MDGYPEREKNPGRLRGNFMYRHWKSKIIIIQDIPTPLPRCNQCGMHNPEARLERQSQTARQNMDMAMQLQQKDVKISHILGDIEFSLHKREGDGLVKGVAHFKYLGHTLDQTDGNWLEICWNINMA